MPRGYKNGVPVRLSHGMRGTPTYGSWISMKRRCLNPSDSDYSNYGAKGITVCDAWLRFEGFFSDMGERPAGKTLDRLDISKGYSKENCRWATVKEQNRNRSDTRILEFNGEKRCMGEWAEILGIPDYLIKNRIDRRGWSIEEALSTPTMGRGTAHIRRARLQVEMVPA